MGLGAVTAQTAVRIAHSSNVLIAIGAARIGHVSAAAAKTAVVTLVILAVSVTSRDTLINMEWQAIGMRAMGVRATEARAMGMRVIRILERRDFVGP